MPVPSLLVIISSRFAFGWMVFKVLIVVLGSFVRPSLVSLLGEGEEGFVVLRSVVEGVALGMSSRRLARSLNNIVSSWSLRFPSVC